MSTLNEPVAKRIGKLVRMFGAREEEAKVAVSKLRILLTETKLSFNDIATTIENANGEIEQFKYSDSDAEVIFARGVVEGRKQNAGPALSAQYFDADSEPRWAEMVKFCQSNPGMTSLNTNEQEMIDKWEHKLGYRTPNRREGGFLLSIFWKLGGSFK
jgi:hypothetical protein